MTQHRERETNIERIYRLTPMQEGLLYHSLQTPQLYIDQFRCRLHGEVDTEILLAAWRAVIAEHEILRTAFIWEHVKQFYQVVLRAVELPARVEDWRGRPADALEDGLQQLAAEEIAAMPRPDRAPLLRVCLIRSAERDVHFIWTIHHMIIDGVSLPLLLRRLFAAYRALRAGETPEASSARPFADYVNWIARQDREAARRYWREQLEGFRRPLAVAPLHDGEAGEASLVCPLPPQLAADLRAAARRQGLAVYQYYNLAYALLLGRWLQRGDVVYGTIVSGRPLALGGMADTIGIFINAVPERMALDAQRSPLELMRRHSMEQVRRNPFEYLPLAEIQQEMETGGEGFTTLFAFENFELETLYADPGTGFAICDDRMRVATHYALTWTVIPEPEAKLRLLYDTGVYTEAQIRAMAQDYLAILAALAPG